MRVILVVVTKESKLNFQFVVDKDFEKTVPDILVIPYIKILDFIIHAFNAFYVTYSFKILFNV